MQAIAKDPASQQPDPGMSEHFMVNSARTDRPGLARHKRTPSRTGRLPYRRISHVRIIRSVTMRDPDSRHRVTRDAATASVTMTADQDSVRAVNLTAAIIKRCRTVLAERWR
jgi:hypothetical protein